MTYFRKSTEDMTLEQAENEFNKVKRSIRDLLYKLGDDCDNVRYDHENLDQDFMRNQYWKLADELDDIYRRLEYLSKDITEQGFIKHNESGRYELSSGTYFTSGSVCEILYTNLDNEQYWLYTSIEHDGKDYYATSLGKEISINGMMVRVRK